MYHSPLYAHCPEGRGKLSMFQNSCPGDQRVFSDFHSVPNGPLVLIYMMSRPTNDPRASKGVL